jgi:hypothetical protein
MNVKHLVWMLPLALVIGLLVGYFDALDLITQAAPPDKIETEMSHHWAWMAVTTCNLFYRGMLTPTITLRNFNTRCVQDSAAGNT